MIQFNSLFPGIEFSGQIILKEWLIQVIFKENKKPGELNFVFCSDDFLLEINKNFLQHDYYTDIITFPTSSRTEIISGEIYISVDRIIDNAKKNCQKFEREFARVLLHGILHLIGYNDHTEEQISLMRTKEDYYLFLLPEI
jgi:rRNA maturation RNase YbeY